MNIAFPQSSPLLTKGNLSVTSSGEDVFLNLGNQKLPMHYEHAMDISRWVRIEAGRIKSNLGLERTTRSLGILHDASAKPKRLAPRPRGPSIHIKRATYSWDRRDVYPNGRLVCIKVGPHVLSLPFRTALKVSQWIRVRAKEARNTAGDTRHWSEIGKVEA